MAAESKSSLTRTLGRTAATFLTAAMSIGTGLFAAPGETVESAGSGLLLAMLLSGLVALFTGLSAASGDPRLFRVVHFAADVGRDHRFGMLALTVLRYLVRHWNAPTSAAAH